jgi:ArsR family transcriptional regulator
VNEPTVLQCCAPLARPMLSDEQTIDLERVFKALADRNRVRMLNILLAAADEEVCVCDFETTLGMKQSLTSYHLKQLVDAGLATRERRGTYSYYRAAAGAVDQLRGLFDPTPLARAV